MLLFEEVLFDEFVDDDEPVPEPPLPDPFGSHFPDFNSCFVVSQVSQVPSALQVLQLLVSIQQ